MAISYLTAFAADDGNVSGGIWLLFSKLFYVLRFPTHTLFWHFFSANHTLFLAGLLINCLLFSFLIERIIAWSKWR